MCISASPKKLSSFDFLPVYKLLNFFFFYILLVEFFLFGLLPYSLS